MWVSEGVFFEEQRAQQERPSLRQCLGGGPVQSMVSESLNVSPQKTAGSLEAISCSMKWATHLGILHKC